MPQREGFPPGVPCWVDSAQPDPQAAARFYGGLFGWAFEDAAGPAGPGPYLVARLGGLDAAAIASPRPGAPPRPVWSTYIAVDDADGAAARVRDAGGTVLVDPADVVDAGRTAVCADTSGAVFHVWQPRAHKGAQVVNAPGTWNWSDLNTPDMAAAQAFYGAVFGWEADVVELGDTAYGMWRLPGYGDFLERFDPELRSRQAAVGAPSGFEDAIAWMVPTGAAEELAHWSVTFAVEDPDAVAARAVELDGSVVVPPYDAPPVRAAVLRDPQGAVFSVSRYDPR